VAGGQACCRSPVRADAHPGPTWWLRLPISFGRALYGRLVINPTDDQQRDVVRMTRLLGVLENVVQDRLTDLRSGPRRTGQGQR
jgi:hypothetical protein